MGPPIDPPNCWRLNGGLSPLACFWKKSFPVSFLSRSYPKIEPCTTFVPDFVTSETAAPPVRPSAAENWLDASWNCSRLSVVKLMSGPLEWLLRLCRASDVRVHVSPH